MLTHDSRQLAAALRRLDAQGATSTQIADAVIATWRAIDAALAPVIGARGVAALYRRGLFLVRTSHPWLAGLHHDTLAEMDLGILAAALVKQDPVCAAAGAGDHLQCVFQLLENLIGPSLTAQLLGPARDNASDGVAGHDRSK